MPTVDEAIDFLKRHNSLHIGESPWDNFSEEDELFPVDWDRLFPRGRPNRDGEPWDLFGDEWELAWDEGFLIDVESALTRPFDPSDHNDESEERWGEWDRCAWYQPIHFFGYDWGIFIRERCVRQAALDIARFMPRLSSTGYGYGFTQIAKALWRAGTYIYFLHEHFHHKVESLGFRLHVVEQASCYLPYMSQVYRAYLNTDDQLEEALANADSYLRLSHQPYQRWISKPVVDATRQYLKWRFPVDGPGYRKAPGYLRKPDFDWGENTLQARVRDASLTPGHTSQDWQLAPRMTQSFLPVTSNIWVVVPVGSRPFVPHGAQPAPTCSTSDLIKLCERHGYKTVTGGGKGSHVKLEKPQAPTLTVSGNRKNLPLQDVKGALKALGEFKLRDLPDLLKEKHESGKA